MVISKGLLNIRIALGVFLGISGAFDNVSTESIMKSIESIALDPTIEPWIIRRLISRRIKAERNDVRMTNEAYSGTPQCGVLSSLKLVVNKLFGNLDDKAPKIVAHTGDIAIVIRRRCLCIITSIMTTKLSTVQN